MQKNPKNNESPTPLNEWKNMKLMFKKLWWIKKNSYSFLLPLNLFFCFSSHYIIGQNVMVIAAGSSLYNVKHFFRPSHSLGMVACLSLSDNIRTSWLVYSMFHIKCWIIKMGISSAEHEVDLRIDVYFEVKLIYCN